VSAGALVFALYACAPAQDVELPPPATRFEGVADVVAGEPVFQAEIDAMVAHGIPEAIARERLRGYALLAAEARRAPGRVTERDLELLRRRAAVQLYLRDLRATIETPSDTEVRQRHEESGDPRPLVDVTDELRQGIENERAFARIVERIAAWGEAVEPELAPDALPQLTDLRFLDGAP
jgi:hypothetical protein